MTIHEILSTAWWIQSSKEWPHVAGIEHSPLLGPLLRPRLGPKTQTRCSGRHFGPRYGPFATRIARATSRNLSHISAGADYDVLFVCISSHLQIPPSRLATGTSLLQMLNHYTHVTESGLQFNSQGLGRKPHSPSPASEPEPAVVQRRRSVCLGFGGLRRSNCQPEDGFLGASESGPVHERTPSELLSR